MVPDFHFSAPPRFWLQALSFLRGNLLRWSELHLHFTRTALDNQFLDVSFQAHDCKLSSSSWFQGAGSLILQDYYNFIWGFGNGADWSALSMNILSALLAAALNGCDIKALLLSRCLVQHECHPLKKLHTLLHSFSFPNRTHLCPWPPWWPTPSH